MSQYNPEYRAPLRSSTERLTGALATTPAHHTQSRPKPTLNPTTPVGLRTPAAARWQARRSPAIRVPPRAEPWVHPSSFHPSSFHRVRSQPEFVHPRITAELRPGHHRCPRKAPPLLCRRCSCRRSPPNRGGAPNTGPPVRLLPAVPRCRCQVRCFPNSRRCQCPPRASAAGAALRYRGTQSYSCTPVTPGHGNSPAVHRRGKAFRAALAGGNATRPSLRRVASIHRRRCTPRATGLKAPLHTARAP